MTTKASPADVVGMGAATSLFRSLGEPARLAILTRLVAERPEGRSSVYSIAVPDHLRRLLMTAEDLLGATGDAVTLCPEYGRLR